MGCKHGVPNRKPEDRGAVLLRFVKFARRDKTCSGCGKWVDSAFLLGNGPTLSELARKAGGTKAEIQMAIHQRGWFCRSCAYRSVIGADTATSTPEGAETLRKLKQDEERMIDMLHWKALSEDAESDLKSGVTPSRDTLDIIAEYQKKYGTSDPE